MLVSARATPRSSPASTTDQLLHRQRHIQRGRGLNPAVARVQYGHPPLPTNVLHPPPIPRCTNSKAAALAPAADSLDVIYGLTIGSAAVSLFGSLFILITYHSIYGSRLVRCRRADGAAVVPPAPTVILYYMSLCDAILDLTYIVDASAVDHRTPEQHASCPASRLGAASRDDAICPFLGGVGQFFALAVVLWTGALAANMHVSMRRRGGGASTGALSHTQLERKTFLHGHRCTTVNTKKGHRRSSRFGWG